MYKFRGKRIDNGEWVYGCLFKHCTLRFIIPLAYEFHTTASKAMSYIEVHPSSVGIEVSGHWFNNDELSEFVKKNLTNEQD
jgi:hypothetical protein